MIKTKVLKPTLLASALAFALVGCTSTTQPDTSVVTHQLAPLDTVSPQLAAMVNAKATGWDVHPQNAEEWDAFVQSFIPSSEQFTDAMVERYNLTVTEEKLAGVPCFKITPPNQAEDKKDKVLVFFHGGGYVLNPGKSGLTEAVQLAGIGGYTIIGIDYRMAPQYPFPAAIDDGFAVYQELIKTVPAEKIGVFGTSTGGAMSLILPLQCQDRGLPLPGAVMAGTPWSDIGKVGDTYFSNEGDDNVLVSYEGWLKEAALVYANGHDLTDPYLSPVYGDYSKFPPLMLVSGTRDLFLSNTVRVQEKMLKAERPVELVVYEGISHAQYYFNPDAPETKQHYVNVTNFFERYLK